MIPRLLALALFTAAVRAADPAPAAPAAATIKDGDTVVLLGDTFFERDYNYGHIESLLTAATAGKTVRFRNLGWSGDTPRCESRSYFGPPAEGFDRLQKQLAEIKPTVVIACYGAVDSFNGQAGVKDFTDSYGRLIEMLQKAGAQVVLMSPPATSTDTKRWPSLEGHAAQQALYRDAVRDLAKARGLVFADLFAAMKDVKLTTVNGVTLTDSDYRAAAPAVVQSLGFQMDAAALSTAQSNAALTKAVTEKNRLFFHRWRPQNETYLFGFRKHEQGNNGVEIPMFDPLIAEKEKQIAGMKR